jgi:hypothetical protein
MFNKYLNNIGLKELQIISLPGTPTCLGPALHNREQLKLDRTIKLCLFHSGWIYCMSAYIFSLTLINVKHKHAQLQLKLQ